MNVSLIYSNCKPAYRDYSTNGFARRQQGCCKKEKAEVSFRCSSISGGKRPRNDREFALWRFYRTLSFPFLPQQAIPRQIFASSGTAFIVSLVESRVFAEPADIMRAFGFVNRPRYPSTKMVRLDELLALRIRPALT